MSFLKFFEIISSLLPEHSPISNPEALARLNPNKIYLENVRSIFNISSKSAQRYCETAVRQGVFLKFVEVVCPNGSIAASAETESRLPETVSCWMQSDGNYEETIFKTSELPKNIFYRLNDEAAAPKAYSRSAQSLRSHSA